MRPLPSALGVVLLGSPTPDFSCTRSPVGSPATPDDATATAAAPSPAAGVTGPARVTACSGPGEAKVELDAGWREIDSCPRSESVLLIGHWPTHSGEAWPPEALLEVAFVADERGCRISGQTPIDGASLACAPVRVEHDALQILRGRSYETVADLDAQIAAELSELRMLAEDGTRPPIVAYRSAAGITVRAARGWRTDATVPESSPVRSDDCPIRPPCRRRCTDRGRWVTNFRLLLDAQGGPMLAVATVTAATHKQLAEALDKQCGEVPGSTCTEPSRCFVQQDEADATTDVALYRVTPDGIEREAAGRFPGIVEIAAVEFDLDGATVVPKLCESGECTGIDVRPGAEAPPLGPVRLPLVSSAPPDSRGR